ncbi:MAG TPA: O-antigen ligase family protein [Gemmatimonadaceae bacterium]|nr:O-antigen ligase family protein [Gemmatimonadaceae bacterium]
MSRVPPSLAWRTQYSRARWEARSGQAADPMLAAAAPAMPVVFGPTDAPPGTRPWNGVGFSLLFLGFLGYIWSITTYRPAVGLESLLVASAGLFLERDARIRVPPFLVLLGVWIVWGALGLAFSPYQPEVTKQLDVLWRIWVITLLALAALSTPARLRFFLFFFLGAFAIYPARGTLLNYAGDITHNGRVAWNYAFSNPNDLAGMTLLLIGLCGAFYIREPKGWPKLAALAGLIILPGMVLITQSRGAFLALACMGLLLLAGQRRRVRTLLIVGAIGAVAALSAPKELWTRIEGLRGVTNTASLDKVDEEGSAEQRFEIWRVSWAIAADHPITGVGVGAYPAAHEAYMRGGAFKSTARGRRDTHSTYFNVLAETGIVGLLLFLGTVGSVFWRAEGVRRRIRAVLPLWSQQLLYLQLGLAAFLSAGIFGSYAKLSYLYLYCATIWVTAEFADRAARGVAASPHPPTVPTRPH